MNVDRHRKHLAVARRGIDDRLRDHALPFLLGRQLIDVAQQVVLDEFVELLAGVELHGCRWRAADGAVDGGGAGVGAAGDRGVDPGAAGLGDTARRKPSRPPTRRPRSTSGSPRPSFSCAFAGTPAAQTSASAVKQSLSFMSVLPEAGFYRICNRLHFSVKMPQALAESTLYRIDGPADSDGRGRLLAAMDKRIRKPRIGDVAAAGRSVDRDRQPDAGKPRSGQAGNPRRRHEGGSRDRLCAQRRRPQSAHQPHPCGAGRAAGRLQHFLLAGAARHLRHASPAWLQPRDRRYRG